MGPWCGPFASSTRRLICFGSSVVIGHTNLLSEQVERCPSHSLSACSERKMWILLDATRQDFSYSVSIKSATPIALIDLNRSSWLHLKNIRHTLLINLGNMEVNFSCRFGYSKSLTQVYIKHQNAGTLIAIFLYLSISPFLQTHSWEVECWANVHTSLPPPQYPALSSHCEWCDQWVPQVIVEGPSTKPIHTMWWITGGCRGPSAYYRLNNIREVAGSVCLLQTKCLNGIMFKTPKQKRSKINGLKCLFTLSNFERISNNKFFLFNNTRILAHLCGKSTSSLVSLCEVQQATLCSACSNS